MRRVKRELTQDEKKLREYLRLRWAVRFGLTLGLAASVVANILHAQDDLISRGLSAWPPVALLLCVEYVTRIPAVRLWRAWARLSVTGVVGGIAGWISYWHMASVAANHGESGPSAYLLPLSVDGLIVVASISLVELNVAIRNLEDKIAAENKTWSVPTVREMVNEVAEALPIPVSPAVPPLVSEPTDPRPPVATARMKPNRPAGRSGPQASGPVKSPLTGSVLLEAPPQA